MVDNGQLIRWFSLYGTNGFNATGDGATCSSSSAEEETIASELFKPLN